MTKRTSDGLPVVTDETFAEFVKYYNFVDANKGSSIIEKIMVENFPIYDAFQHGKKVLRENSDFDFETRRLMSDYLEMGIQITYELLRIQSRKLQKTENHDS